jgi:RNA-directed DNA polymerase
LSFVPESATIYWGETTGSVNTGAIQVNLVALAERLTDSLRGYLLGWKAYFGLAQTPRVWRTLDEWLRHRLRAIQLKQWKRGSTIYRELLNLGAAEHVARRVAQNARCWWRNSDGDIKRVLTIAYFDKLGVPRLS